MSNGRALFVVVVILATFGALAVAGGPALDPGDAAGPDSNSTGTSDPTPNETDGSGPSTGMDGSPESTRPAVVSQCAATPPADHSDPAGSNSDTIGWVDGYWYSEALDIDAEGGLTETELEMVSARAAARFEAIRCLTADEGVPPVEIQSREQFRENQSGLFDFSQDRRLADNAALAIRLISGTETDSVEQREQNRGVAVGGTYNFRTDEIVIVSDDSANLTIDEAVLAHEIGHAIQDQQFDLAQYERNTTDRDKAILGLIEGDVHYVEQQYREACTTDGWDHGCLSYDSAEGDGSQSTPANWGLLFQTLQPYNDGPAFVKYVYENGDGWPAVNDAYDTPPTSALEVVRPERYPNFEPTELTVPDNSSAGWTRYNDTFGPGYDQIGVAGISSMFIAPTIESNGEFTIYTRAELLADDDLRTYQYFQAETAGWRGDRLYTYRGDGNETGAVWATEWRTAEARDPFVQSYTELIEYRGGERVGENTYRFAPETGYDMALEIRTNGTRVSIVTAPSVEQLAEVHPPESSTGV